MHRSLAGSPHEAGAALPAAQSGVLADADVFLLSTLRAWVARSYELTPDVSLALVGIAIGNAVCGLLLMLLLMRDKLASKREQPTLAIAAVAGQP